jgi:hypothetical protein
MSLTLDAIAHVHGPSIGLLQEHVVVISMPDPSVVIKLIREIVTLFVLISIIIFHS